MSRVMIKPDKLTYQSLGDKAADFIRDRIIRQEYLPGMRLTEESFANDLGVSRACVREAFMLLETEGLVRRVRNKYTEVVAFTNKDVEEIFIIRAVVETLAAETCARRDLIPVKELEKQIEIIASLSKEGVEDTKGLVDADLGFHEIIVRASGNSRALSVWNYLRSQMMVVLFAALESKTNIDRFRGREIHSAILEAMVKKDIPKLSSELIDGARKAIGYVLDQLEFRVPSSEF